MQHLLRLVFLISLVFGAIHILTAQSEARYSMMWDSVSTCEREGQRLSAVQVVQRIAGMAMAEGQPWQRMKALHYEVKSAGSLTDNIQEGRLLLQAFLSGVNGTSVGNTSFDEKTRHQMYAIAASWMAEWLATYYNGHRFEIENLSDVQAYPGIPLQGWSGRIFQDSIRYWYIQSVQGPDILQYPTDSLGTLLDNYSADSTPFLPTLFDLLASRAFLYFSRLTYTYTPNDDAFIGRQTGLFFSSSRFVSFVSGLPASDSYHYQSLKILGSALAHASGSTREESGIYWDLLRLKYVAGIATHPEGDGLYLTALDTLLEEASETPQFADIAYTKAQFLYQKNMSGYATEIDTLCLRAIRMYPKAPGTRSCRELFHTLHRMSYSIGTQHTIPSDIPATLRIRMTNNAPGAVLRVYAISASTYVEEMESKQENRSAHLHHNTKPVYATPLTLPVGPVATEQVIHVSLPRLPVGHYYIEFYPDSSVAISPARTWLQVSDMIWTSFNNNTRTQMQIFHRRSGKPIAGARITLLGHDYMWEQRTYVESLVGAASSDKYGRASFVIPEGSTVYARVFKGSDTLITEKIIASTYVYTTQDALSVQLMTDRSLYRPGQSLYFKGIVLNNNKDGIPSVVPSCSVKLEWKDPNDQDISSQTFVTNGFGSFQGTVSIPTDRLAGLYTLVITGANIYSSLGVMVEEYRRPTFTVDITPDVREADLMDSVKVRTSVNNMAGVPLQNATLAYRILRTQSYFGAYRRFPSRREEEIASGICTTDTNGIAKFAFVASQNSSEVPTDEASYNFTVSVIVTDSRGETQSEKTIVSASRSQRYWELVSPSETDVSDTTSVRMIARFRNQSRIRPASTRIKIVKLKEPESMVEYGTVTREHPHVYGSDETPALWDSLKEEKVICWAEYRSGDYLRWPGRKEPGIYRIIFDDSLGLGTVFYMVLTDWKLKKWPKANYLYTKTDRTKAAPGDVVTLHMSTPGETVWAHVLVYQSNRILIDKVMKIRKETLMPVPITEAERGGIGILISYVKNNQLIKIRHALSIPWSDKQFQVQVKGLRKKTAPGSTQTYSIHIANLQAGSNAEVLAAMYDMSLDELAYHRWYRTEFPDRQGNISLVEPEAGECTSLYMEWPQFRDTVSYHTSSVPVMTPVSIDMYGMMAYEQRAMPSAEQVKVDDPSSVTGSESKQKSVTDENTSEKKTIPSLSIRRNLRETVFFMPQLYTDVDGMTAFTFTMNEALTRWRLMIYAHDKGFASGYYEDTVETFLPLMVFPHLPRYLREGDTIRVTAGIENRTKETVAGYSRIQFFDAATGEEITRSICQGNEEQRIEIQELSSMTLSWEITIPLGKWQAVTWRVAAGNADFEDAEENTIPVHSSRILVTEALPFSVPAKSKSTVSFSQLPSPESNTVANQRYIAEYTAHPVWFAIQSMPYIHYQSDMSSVGLAHSLFVNQLGRHIIKQNPRIAQVMAAWRTDPMANKSPLEKNADLKTALLQETPWLRDAMDETASRRDISLLLDENQLQQQQSTILTEIRKRQSTNGGIAWLPDSPPDQYTTRYILEKIGYLHRLGVLDATQPEWVDIAGKAIAYLDKGITFQYRQLMEMIQKHNGNPELNHLSADVVYTLFVRSHFSYVSATESAEQAYQYYLGQIQKYWVSQPLSVQAMAGIILFRDTKPEWTSLVRSLREKAVQHPELGMYWPSGRYSSWNDWPLERHSHIVLLFAETGTTTEELSRLHLWLLRQKQTSGWQSPIATILAVNALLQSADGAVSSTLLTDNSAPDIRTGPGKDTALPLAAEAGTGYVKQVWSGAGLSDVKDGFLITNNGPTVAWGSLYLQYTEREERVPAAPGSALQLSGRWFRMGQTDTGERLVPVDSNTQLRVGDKLVLRLIITADRHLEYLHLRAAHPAGTEANASLSGYTYKGALWYYRALRDAAAEYYISSIEKGTFVVEHEVRITHAGIFEGGTASIECMYAPEFRARTASQKLVVR